MTQATRLAAGIVETTEKVDKSHRSEDVNGAESGCATSNVSVRSQMADTILVIRLRNSGVWGYLS